MKITLIILISFSFLSCSIWTRNSKLKKRDTNNYFLSSGVLQNFHQNIPRWINFRPDGRCFLNYDIKYLKFFDMSKSLRLSYKDSTHFQLMYNFIRAEEKRKSVHNKVDFQLSFKNEEKIFYRVSQSIQARIYLFRAPIFKRVNLVWIDSALGNIVEMRKLKKLLNSKEMNLGHPVFVSECLSRMELETFRDQLIPNSMNIRLVSSEMFSNYNSKSIQVPYFGIDFSAFFHKDQQLYLYTNWVRPMGFKGPLTIKKY